MLQDELARRITYLRVSVTDRCNYLCTYCAPAEGWSASKRSELLSFEEIFETIRVLAWRGVRRVRFTGGEPLLRRDLPDLIARVHALPEIEEIAITTNAHLLSRFAEPLFEAGARRLNISVDTFDAQEFERITRGGSLREVVAGIDKAREVGFEDLQLNAVLTPELRQDATAWLALCHEAWARDMTPRWIEMMPIGGQIAPPITVADVLRGLRSKYPFEELSSRTVDDSTLDPTLDSLASALAPTLSNIPRGPARYYQTRAVTDSDGRARRVGLISPMSDPHFCASCNRARLTARGGLRACLADDREVSLKDPLRAGLNGPALNPFIDEAIYHKRPQHLMNIGAPPRSVMTGLGG